MEQFLPPFIGDAPSRFLCTLLWQAAMVQHPGDVDGQIAFLERLTETFDVTSNGESEGRPLHGGVQCQSSPSLPDAVLIHSGISLGPYADVNHSVAKFKLLQRLVHVLARTYASASHENRRFALRNAVGTVICVGLGASNYELIGVGYFRFAQFYLVEEEEHSAHDDDGMTLRRVLLCFRKAQEAFSRVRDIAGEFYVCRALSDVLEARQMLAELGATLDRMVALVEVMPMVERLPPPAYFSII